MRNCISAVHADAPYALLSLRDPNGRPHADLAVLDGVLTKVHVVVRDEGSWSGGLASHTAVCGGADANLRPRSRAESGSARSTRSRRGAGRRNSPRTAEQTAIARFYTANVIRQFNIAARDLATAHALSLLQTARLLAMVNTASADALMSVLNSKYRFLFWRPVTAIDPTAVTADGYGPVPGFDDGNPATAEEPGWRPLVVTPNHPEYPGAHGTNTSAIAEVFSEFLGTDNITQTSTVSTLPARLATSMPYVTTTPRTNFGARSSTRGCGAAFTTASQARQECTSDRRSRTTASTTRSDQLTDFDSEGRGTPRPSLQSARPLPVAPIPARHLVGPVSTS
jgi:hypothetical protein